MLLHRITSVKELLEFAPLVVKKLEKDDPKGYLRQSPETDLINSFFAKFYEGFYYGSISKGELDYFCVWYPYVSPNSAWVWLFYVNPSKHAETSNIIKQIKSEARLHGITEAFFTTTRMKSSYKRWAEKNGASMFSISYKMEVI